MVEVSCSFCGKSQSKVKKLVAGPIGGPSDGVHIYICNECVALCVDIMKEEGIE